jgi:hypothetical protein
MPFETDKNTGLFFLQDIFDEPFTLPVAGISDFFNHAF